MTDKKKTIPAHYSWNSSIFTRGVVDPIKRKLGYVDENEHPVSLKESATGQELDRMNDTAKKAATIAMTGLGVSSVPALARYAVSLPQVAIPEIVTGLGTGIAGAKLGEKVGQALGGDGYWGSLIGGFGVGAAGVRGFSNFNRLRNMKTYYTGVPHKPLNENPHISMDEAFPKYNGTIWTSDNPNFAEEWINQGQGKVFKVLAEPEKLKVLDTPSAGDEYYFSWRDLPYKVVDGKIVENPNPVITKSTGVFKSPEESQRFLTSMDKSDLQGKSLSLKQQHNMSSVNNPTAWAKENGITLTRTDDIVNAAQNEGYQAVQLHDIYDGPLRNNNGLYDSPIDEFILSPNTPHIVLPQNKSKWSLLFKNLNKIQVKKYGGILKRK